MNETNQMRIKLSYNPTVHLERQFKIAYTNVGI